MVLYFDLDNTLIDRSAAFGEWATDFVRTAGFGPDSAEWLITEDRDGYEPRERLATRLKERLRLRASTDDVVTALLFEHVEYMGVKEAVRTALRRARDAGNRTVVITNGTHAQQRMKIERTGLDEYFDAVVISEAVGAWKPDPEIFQIAAVLARSDVGDGWMIGDNPAADIQGGAAIGLRTGWVSRDRVWPAKHDMPDVIGHGVSEVIDQLLE